MNLVSHEYVARQSHACSRSRCDVGSDDATLSNVTLPVEVVNAILDDRNLRGLDISTIPSHIVIDHAKEQPPEHDHNAIVHILSCHRLKAGERAEDHGEDQPEHGHNIGDVSASMTQSEYSARYAGRLPPAAYQHEDDWKQIRGVHP